MTTERILFVCDGAPVPAPLSRDAGLTRKTINCHGPTTDLNLRIDNISAAMLTDVSDRSTDLVHIASYIYGADQEISRGGSADVFGSQWRRHMILCIPVVDPAFWSQEAVRGALVRVLQVVSGDNWEFHFTLAPPEAQQLTLNFGGKGQTGNPDTVMLLSGGADSLCAAVQAVAEDGRTPLLVSHRSSPPLDARQQTLVDHLQDRLQPASFPHISFWVHRKGSDAADDSQRSRAFLFAALGAVVAAELGIGEVQLADNGLVSLNPPINAQLVGTLASRSTHPKFIAAFNVFVGAVWPSAPRVVNPLWDRTRAETLAILERADVADLLQETVSCSRSRGRPLAQPQCGSCYQCVDRRFGALAAGLEHHDLSERYGLDPFTTELAPGDPRTVAVSYVRFAQEVAETNPEDLYLKFPQLEDCILSGDPDTPRIAKALADLMKRHAESTLSVVSQMISHHQDELAHGTLAEHSLLRLVVGSPRRVESVQEVDSNEFRRDGKLRIMTFANRTRPIPDSIGLRYIERLLQMPGREVHVRELAALEQLMPVSQAQVTAAEAVDAGLSLASKNSLEPDYDDDAMADLESDLRNLSARRLEAEAENDTAELEVIDRAREQIEDYLRAGTGFGGHRRQVRPEDQKVHDAVLKAIQRSRRDILASHPALARHLKQFLHAGWVCCYAPDPPIPWTT